MTTMTPTTRLMDNARTHLPGALDGAMKLELFNVYDEFFQGSKSWTDEIEFTLRAGRTEADLVTSEPGVIEGLVWVLNSDRIPVAATMPIPGTLRVQTAPLEDLTLTATVSLTVVDPTSNDYPQVPDWLLLKYGAGILDGLLSRMMAQPAKPYTNERMGIFHTRRFRNTIVRAKAEAEHQNLFSGQTWRFPQFARGSQR